jgi:hypothetical protein
MMDELDLYWMWTTLDCPRGEVICDICITLLVMGIFILLLIGTFWHSSV